MKRLYILENICRIRQHTQNVHQDILSVHRETGNEASEGEPRKTSYEGGEEITSGSCQSGQNAGRQSSYPICQVSEEYTAQSGSNEEEGLTHCQFVGVIADPFELYSIIEMSVLGY